MTEEIKTGTETAGAAATGTEKKEAPAITEQSVVDKVSKGEKLSPEETELFKAIPPGSIPPTTPAAEKKDEKGAQAAPSPSKPGEKKETPGAASSEVTAERRALIEAELAKPDSEVDLSKFKSPVELGLYWDLKKTRRKLDRTQETLDIERVERIVERLQGKKAEGTVQEQADDTEIVALLKDLKPDDVITVEDVQKAIKARDDRRQKKKDDDAAAAKTGKPGILTMDQVRVQKLEAESFLRAKNIDDFHEVTEFAEAALKDDAEAIAILQDTAKAGGNTALKTYYLVKGSKHWAEIEKVIKETREKAGKGSGTGTVSQENKDRAAKIEENDGKTKTTGTGSGGNTGPHEYTLGEIQSMTAKDVRKLSKDQRKQILEKFGSQPNFST